MNKVLAFVISLMVGVAVVLTAGGEPLQPTTSTTSTLALTPLPTSTTTSTTSTTTTTQAVVVRKGRCRSFEALLEQHGLPSDPFTYIAWRESRCNPDIVNARWNAKGELVWTLNKNGTYDTGLLQINSGHRELVRKVCGARALKDNLAGLRDLDCQLRVAAHLYNGGKGLSHWVVKKQDN